ncbi:MAG: regulatory protein RecX [Oscillospiraceae bacterium]
MIIVSISTRKKSLYALQFSEELDPSELGAMTDCMGLLTLNRDTCSQYGLKENMEISQETLLEIIEASYVARAKSRAMWYIERSDCSKKQLIQKLGRAFPLSAAVAAADRMEELGFIDDERYAKHLAEVYLTERRVAPRKAEYMLVTKGIERDTAAEAVGQIETDSVDIICELIERKYKNKLSDEKLIQKTIAALARRGFSYSDIRTAIQKYNTEIELLEE